MVQQTEHHLLAERGAAIERLEVREGPTGRRRWPDEVKARLVLDSFRPGARVADIARRNGIAPQHLSTWRRLARQGKLPLPADGMLAPGFAAIVVEEEGAPPDAEAPLARARPSCATAAIEIAVGAVTVRLPGESSADRIAAVAAALVATA